MNIQPLLEALDVQEDAAQAQPRPNLTGERTSTHEPPAQRSPGI
ncbi:hypothetical protein [Streptomyces sioyaensis]